MFATKMVSALTLTFFIVLLTAGKMLGVPRKERNRLRRVERWEGRLRTQWSGRGEADWTPGQPVFLLRISKAQRSNYRHFQPLVTQHPTEGTGQDGECECVSQWRELCVCVPSLAQNTSCRLRGILYLKTDAFGNSHIFRPVNHTCWVK